MKSLDTTPELTVPGAKATIYEFNPLQDPRWVPFTDRCPAASLAHRREWLHALQTTYGCEPVALTTCTPDSALTDALVFCRVRSWLTGNRLVSVPFTDHCEPLGSGTAEIDGLVASLIATVVREHWRYFEIRPLQYVPSPHFGMGMFLTYVLHRLDLRQSEEALFKSFHKSCIQRKILKAEREGLRCEEGSTETLLRQFYKLLIVTRRRFGLPPQPLSWFRNLVASLGHDLKIRVAYKGTLPVASILTIRTGPTMEYKYGCSDVRFSNQGGMPLLLWNAIREARAAGLAEFGFGRSDMDQQGLIAFKDHWGAVRSPLNYWCYPAPRVSARRVGATKLFKKVASRAPSASLVMLGNLLYRHIA